MHLINPHTVLALAALNTVASALPQSGQKPHSQNAKAVYAITNSEKNSIVAIPVMKDGTLGNGVLTETQGMGASAVNGTGSPAATDTLVSQSAVTIAGQHIFAVNAGSNTVSMLAISHKDPTQLRMVGKPASVPGTFPNTVAASVKNNMVCVATSGSKAGVSCGSFSKQGGIGEMRQIASFDLKQTDPPSSPPNTVSHTFFSADESMLFTTVKGDPAVNNTGFLSAVPVSQAANGDCEPMVGKEVRSSPNGTALLFGSAPIPGTKGTQFVTTDPSFGAGIVSVDAEGKGQLASKADVKDQAAICWATIAAGGKTAWIADVGVNRLLEMSLMNSSIVGMIDMSMGPSAMNPGAIDLRAAGNFVYAMSPGNGTSPAAVSVIDVMQKKVVQNAELKALGVSNTAMGMTLLM